MEQHDRETPVTPEQRALIEEAMRLAVEQTLMAGNSITKEHRLNACRAVERRLYGLPHLYARIRRDRERLQALEGAGAADPVSMRIRQGASAKLAADESEAAELAEALSAVRGDYYYRALMRRYFHCDNDDDIAERLHCDASTVRRNRIRLLEALALRLGMQ